MPQVTSEGEFKTEEIESFQKKNLWFVNIKCNKCKENPILIFNEKNLTYTLICDNHSRINIPILILFEDYLKFENYICCSCYKMRDQKRPSFKLLRCLSCKKCYCHACSMKHTKKLHSHHNFIDVDQMHNFCFKHNLKYEKFCENCHKHLCKLCLEENNQRKCITYNHNLKDISELILNKNNLVNNSKVLTEIHEKTKIFKEMIINWKKELDKKINEFLSSIDKMELLYKFFSYSYKIQNYYDFRVKSNNDEIKNINEKWAVNFKKWNELYEKDKFFDFQKMSEIILNFVNDMDSLKIKYYFTNFKNNLKQCRAYKNEAIQIIRKLISQKNNLILGNDNKIINSLNNILNKKELGLGNYNINNIFDNSNKIGLSDTFKLNSENDSTNVYFKRDHSNNSLFERDKSLKNPQKKQQHKTLFKVIQYEENAPANNNNNNQENSTKIKFMSNNMIKNNNNLTPNNTINNSLNNNNNANQNIPGFIDSMKNDNNKFIIDKNQENNANNGNKDMNTLGNYEENKEEEKKNLEENLLKSLEDNNDLKESEDINTFSKENNANNDETNKENDLNINENSEEKNGEENENVEHNQNQENLSNANTPNKNEQFNQTPSDNDHNISIERKKKGK